MTHISSRLCLTLAVVLAACTPPPPPDTSEADRAVLGSAGAFLTAWNAADVATMAGMYADDAIELVPDGPPNVGRDAILKGAADYFAQFTATQTATVDEVNLHGDLAVTRGTWTVRETPKTGGAEQTRHGKWIVVHKRDTDGTWRTWRWMWNEDRAAPVVGM